MELAALQEALPRDGLLRACEVPEPAFEPVAEGADDSRLLACELVREGYLLHYGKSRLYESADADLTLLAGDRMYAAGLDRLARQGDLDAVGVLAGLIAHCAEAHASQAAAEAAETCNDLWRDALARLQLRAILARGL